MRKTLSAVLALLAAAVLGEDRIYQGHYASGIAKYTVKGPHVYAGNYASGISAWTTGTSSDLLHVYKGHYASGISKFTYRNRHLYAGHYASGVSAWTVGESSGLLHIYKGHYASGISKFTFKNGHVYRGHYASGISAWTFKTTDEVPEGLLVFLVTQVLEPEEEAVGGGSGSSGSGSGSTGGSGSAGGGTVVDVPVRPPVTPVEPEPPVVTPEDPAPPVAWRRARTLRGVLEEDGAVVAGVEVKCGKADRRGEAKISVQLTPFVGSRRSFRSVKVAVSGGTAVAAWPREGLRLEVGEDAFDAELGTRGRLRSARIGGALPAGGHRLRVRVDGPAGVLRGYALDEGALPADVGFAVSGGKWTFGAREPSRPRLSYNAAKGTFKGSFKALYAPADGAAGRRRPRSVTVKVAGLVVEGAGVGAGSTRTPAQAYSVSVE